MKYKDYYPFAWIPVAIAGIFAIGYAFYETPAPVPTEAIIPCVPAPVIYNCEQAAQFCPRS